MNRTAPLHLVLLSLLSMTPACGARAASYAARESMAGGTSVASMPSSGSADSESDYTASVAPAAPSARMAQAPSDYPTRPSATAGAAPSRAAHGTAPVRTSAVAPTRAEGTSATVQQAPSAQVLLIYTAQLAAQVDHVPSGIDQIVDALTAQGGFLASRSDNTVTMRVPVARFREALGRIESLSTVLGRQVQAEDVTESFHNLEVQLSNLRSVQTRLQQFLARANNVAEALAVEHELERVGGQIDEIEGRMRFLANRAAFSTITVTLTARPQTGATPTPTPGPVRYAPIPEGSLPFDVLEQLGLPRLLTAR
jgi:hypothetical protein